jgi:hypothetical protein
MLRFDVYHNGQPVTDIELSGAYLFGQESIPVRSDLAAESGRILCPKRVPGACGLALLWECGAAGRFLLPTTRLPDRAKPYNLNVELARAQLMRIAQKREDWGLFDFPSAEGLNSEFNAVRKEFVRALKTDDGGKAADVADRALVDGVTVGEKMALFHADVLLDRRRAVAQGSPARAGFGCMIDLLSQSEPYQQRLVETFDFFSIPMAWNQIELKEHSHDFGQVDSWVNWAARVRRPIHAGPLVSFEQASLPEWLYIWENDYETLRELIYEHIQQVVKRYEKQVSVWKVVSGINAYNSFDLNFEQLMELTRMSCLLVKKLVPRAQVIIELAMPWGEYYARNPRTVPPLLYADMAVQSGIKFDGFGIQIYMGVPEDGFFVRDLMQISSLLDELVVLSKPIHVTACEVPSDTRADNWDAWGGKAVVSKAGCWHNPWSQRLQAEWLQAFFRVAMSKPYVESICWRDLADYEGHHMPHGGLCRNDLEPKLAYKELRNFKASLVAANQKRAANGNSNVQ